MDKHMSIQFSSAIQTMKSINDSFDSAILRIAYHGKNRNGSYISKQAFEEAIPTMFNCPVVTHYQSEMVDEKGLQGDFGGHDGHLEIKDDGQTIVYVVDTQPIGVIPESAQFWWETVNDDGELHEYLCTEVILWKRQDAYNKLVEGKRFNQSMEISIHDAEMMMDGSYNIKKFNFEAFCVLSNSIEPCFETASVTLYSLNKNKFMEQFNQMISELKNTLIEGGAEMQVDNEELLVEEVKSEETVETPVVETPIIETPVEETIETPVEEVAIPNETEEPVIETPIVEEIVTEEPVSDGKPIEEVVEETENSEGFSLTADKLVVGSIIPDTITIGDLVVIDSKDNKIFELNTELSKLKVDYSALLQEIEELRKYKNDNELEKSKQQKESLFAEFSIGLTDEEMRPVKEKMNELTVAEMKVQLNEIFTQKNLSDLKSKITVEPKVEVIQQDILRKDNPKSRYAV